MIVVKAKTISNTNSMTHIYITRYRIEINISESVHLLNF